MVDRFQFLRSSTPNTKPLVNTGAAGEIWTNFADLQFGLIDPTRTAVPLIAVRYFSAATAYVGGDCVIQGGKIYFAKAAVPIGPFNAAQWTAMVNAADVAALYLPLAGGTLTGPVAMSSGALTLSGPPTSALHAATKAYADGFLPLAGGALAGPLTLAADPSAALGASTKQYVDAKITALPASFLPLAGGTLTGTLTGTNATFPSGSLSSYGLNLSATMGQVNYPTIAMGKGASTGACVISSYTGQFATAGLRWQMQLGDAAAESGGNAGSNLTIYNYGDGGANIGAPFQIIRATGAIVAGSGGIGVNRSDGGSAGPTNAANIGIHPLQGVNSEIASGSVPFLANRIGSNGGVMSIRENNFICGSITVSGQTSTAFNTTSDERLKTDERSFDAGAILDKLKVYDFEWKESKARAYGVMAQETNEVFADAVVYDKKEDWWGVDYSKFVPLLLQEIKALRARVAALEGSKPV